MHGWYTIAGSLSVGVNVHNIMTGNPASQTLPGPNGKTDYSVCECTTYSSHKKPRHSISLPGSKGKTAVCVCVCVCCVLCVVCVCCVCVCVLCVVCVCVCVCVCFTKTINHTPHNQTDCGSKGYSGTGQKQEQRNPELDKSTALFSVWLLRRRY